MRNKCILFVGRIEKCHRLDLWVPFCEKNDFDVYVVSYANSIKESNDYVELLESSFGERLKKVYIDRTVVDKLEYNNWNIDKRTIQHYRMWDFFMKTPVLNSYSYVAKSRLDLIIPTTDLHDVSENSILLPFYKNHPYGLVYSDQFAYGDVRIMKKYFTMWETIPEYSPYKDKESMRLSFYNKYSPETMVTDFIKNNNIKTVNYFDNPELQR